MKANKYTKEQIVAVLREGEAGFAKVTFGGTEEIGTGLLNTSLKIFSFEHDFIECCYEWVLCTTPRHKAATRTSMIQNVVLSQAPFSIGLAAGIEPLTPGVYASSSGSGPELQSSFSPCLS